MTDLQIIACCIIIFSLIIIALILDFGRELILDILFKFVPVRTLDGQIKAATTLSIADQHTLIKKYVKKLKFWKAICFLINIMVIIRLFAEIIA